ncbi:hypothetical protein DDA93_01710 [Arthrobacter sp. Bz4]|nr:hypothetical protein DDA93_01710 [Arthrobacter sp. Bz4]
MGIDHSQHCPFSGVSFSSQGSERFAGRHMFQYHRRVQDAERVKLWQTSDTLYADIQDAEATLRPMDFGPFPQPPAVGDPHMEPRWWTQHPEVSLRCGTDPGQFSFGTRCSEQTPSDAG